MNFTNFIKEMKGKFHLYHFITNSFSTLMYLLLSSVNAVAAGWGLSFATIGIMNFVGALCYVGASLALGRLGDKYGHKAVMSGAVLLFALFNVLGFFWSNVLELFIFIIGIDIFFGIFFPQMEGLLSKQEKALGADAASTVNRFNLSWSTGNILGIILGPLLIMKAPFLVFTYSIFLCLFTYIVIRKDLSKNGETLHFNPAESVRKRSNMIDFPRIRLYRRVYRTTLILSGFVYAAFLSLFPKIATFSNIPISISGVLAAGANLGVFVTFIALGKIRVWVGNPVKAFFLMIGFPILVFLLFLPPSIISFFLLAFFAGITYAVPYTYAIFYALNSPEEDHSKQGGFHEATIGIMSGFGPLIGGVAIQINNGILGLAVMALILLVAVVGIQFSFIRKVKKA